MLTPSPKMSLALDHHVAEIDADPEHGCAGSAGVSA